MSGLEAVPSLTTLQLALVAAGIAGLVAFHLRRHAARRRAIAAAATGLAYELRWSALAAFSNEAVLLLDRDGRILQVNDRAAQMYGWSREELLQLSMRDLRAPDERPSLEGHLHAVRSAGELRVETTHARKDGATFAVESGGRLVGTFDAPQYQVIVRDIDARKAAEEALRESEERWRTIATAAHDPIITVDNLGLVTYWNPAAERLFGYLSGEVIGRNLHTFFVPERYHAAHHAAFPAWQRS
ncbi:MAG: PAS domain S-box protein, partial [Vicinamibacterales bacterium]